MITTTSPEKAHDIFKRGLKRTAMRMPFDPAKRYFCVEDPKEGWRVFLRACCFIHEKPAPGEAIDFTRFIVVKKAGSPAGAREWEPPKGQMEGKDGLRNPADSLQKILKDNVKREVAEEARIHQLQNIDYTGIVLEGIETSYEPNTFFQYHVFRATVSAAEFRKAAEELAWYREHPAAFAKLKRDKREKDEIAWYSPRETQISGRWSSTLVGKYLKTFA